MASIPLALKPRAVSAPAPSAPASPVWDNIDPATLPEDLAKLYYAYQKAQSIATEARRLFESETNEAFDAGPGNRLAFGYKFGKLSVAIVPDAPRISKNARILSEIAKPR